MVLRTTPFLLLNKYMFNKKLKRRLAELESLLGYAWVNGGGYFNHEVLSYGAINNLEERINKLEPKK